MTNETLLFISYVFDKSDDAYSYEQQSEVESKESGECDFYDDW